MLYPHTHTYTLSHTPLYPPCTAYPPTQDNLPPGSLGDLAPDRDMTFEEKRKLSAHMASIPGEKLVAVLDIIQEGEVRQRGGGGMCLMLRDEVMVVLQVRLRARCSMQ